MTYRRKNGLVTAVQWRPGVNIPGVKETAPERGSITPRAILRVPHGTFFVVSGDWVLTGDGGRRWVVEQDEFPLLYEMVDHSPEDNQ